MRFDCDEMSRTSFCDDDVEPESVSIDATFSLRGRGKVEVDDLISTSFRSEARRACELSRYGVTDL
jgi:hypothetical protein